MAWNDNLEGSALEIASTNANPLRVVAGPGTGKTFALMRRVARLLEEGNDPTGILLVTFTRVAANDLQQEIRKLNVANSDLIRKGTLHSFCFSMLMQGRVLELTNCIPRILLNFEEKFVLYDLSINDLGAYHVCKKRLKAFEAAWAREQDQEPGPIHNEVDRRFSLLLDEWLRFHRGMLLGELIPITLRYLRDNPACPERNQYNHILVDEYQDLNRAEQSLIELLSQNGNLMIVGDEDQSIYENFRYAHPEGISEFRETHANTHDVPLDECRRCPTSVVAIANNLIGNNLRREGRELVAKEGNIQGEINVVQWDNMNDEAEGIANYIHSKKEAGEFEFGKILVLCPNRMFGYLIRAALRNKAIPSRSFFSEELFDGNPKILEESKSQQAFTLLSLLTNPNDIVALRCWLGYGHYDLACRQYQILRDYCANTGGNPDQVLRAVMDGRLQVPRIGYITQRYRSLQEKLAELSNLDTNQVLETTLPRDQEWAVTLRLMVDNIPDNWTISDALEHLRSHITQPELPTDVDYVRVMSLHKSKGLTADHVVVAGLIEGLIPSRKDDLPFEEQMRYVEEQRRLFYVAITRPKKTIVLSSVLNLPRNLANKMGVRLGNGNREQGRTMTSTFIGELGDSCPRPILGSEWDY